MPGATTVPRRELTPTPSLRRASAGRSPWAGRPAVLRDMCGEHVASAPSGRPRTAVGTRRRSLRCGGLGCDHAGPRLTPRPASVPPRGSAWPPTSSTPPPRPGSTCSPPCAATGSWRSSPWSCSSPAAVVLGLKRPVHYTTTANLSVGHVYVSNPVGHPDHHRGDAVAGRPSTAGRSTPARSCRTRGAGSARARSPVSGGLSATPIPQSPLIKVSARVAIAARSGRAGERRRRRARGLRQPPGARQQRRPATHLRALPRGLAGLSHGSLDTSDRLARRYATGPDARPTRPPATAPRPPPTPRSCAARP